MKAKFYVLDFVNYIVGLCLGIFVFFYFSDYNRFLSFAEFLEQISKFSFFGIVFFIFLKRNAKEAVNIKLREKQSDYFQIIKYLDYKTERLDWFYIISLPLIVLALAYILDDVNKTDLLQASVVFYIAAMTHKIFFKKKNDEERNFLTVGDKLIDEIMIYSLPLFIYGIAMLFRVVNKCDFFQAITVLIVSCIWHYYFFKPNK